MIYKNYILFIHKIYCLLDAYIYFLIISNWCKTMLFLQRSLDDVMCLRSDELSSGLLPTGLVVDPKADPNTISLTILNLRQSGEIITYDDQQSLSFSTLFKSKTEPKILLISILREGAFFGANKLYFGRLGQCFKTWYDDTFCFSPKHLH